MTRQREEVCLKSEHFVNIYRLSGLLEIKSLLRSKKIHNYIKDDYGDFMSATRIKNSGALSELLDSLIREISKSMLIPPKHALKVWALNGILQRSLDQSHSEEALVKDLIELASSQFVQRITALMRRSPEKLNSLSGQRRRTFILSYLEGLSDEEAADCCSLTVCDYQRQKDALLKSLD